MKIIFLVLLVVVPLSLVQSQSASERNCITGYRKSTDCKMLYNDTPISCGESCCQMPRAKRIRRGRNTTENEFPWSVAIFEKSETRFETRYKFFCGGVVISGQKIATAAHCVTKKNVSHLYVTIGEADISVNDKRVRVDNYDKLKAIQRIDFFEFEKAPLSDTNSAGFVFRNDLAILTLAETVESPRICLRIKYDSPEKAECFGISYGKTEEGVVTGRLQKGKVNLDFENKCLIGIHDRNSGYMLCASKGGKTVSCQMDSGSPVVCRLKGRCPSYYLAGLFSFNVGSDIALCRGTASVLVDLLKVNAHALVRKAADHAQLNQIQSIGKSWLTCDKYLP